MEDTDIEKEKLKMKESGGYKENEIEKFFDERKESISERIITEKLFEFLLNNTKLKKSHV